MNSTCKSRIKQKWNVDLSWCDGSDIYAYEIHLADTCWQAIAIHPTHWHQELHLALFTGGLRKVSRLPRDHWHHIPNRDRWHYIPKPDES